MSKTGFATNDALTKKHWEEKLYREMAKESYFYKFTSEDKNNVFTLKTQLEKDKGDQVTFGLRARLVGDGVGEGETLEGKEESLKRSSFTVSLVEKAHATRDEGPLDRQRAIFSIDSDSEDALRTWGTEFIDAAKFNVLQSSPTTKFYGGTATSDATLASTDKLTPALISKMKAYAKTGGGGGTGFDSRTRNPLRPIKVNGKDYYILLVHPEQLYDLTVDTTFAAARREADVRGKENPVFTGAYAIWDGVIIHDHENIQVLDTYGSGGNVRGAKALFLGAQAGVWAWGKRPGIVAEQFDYGREHGYSIQMIYGTAKTNFTDPNSSTNYDYGMFSVTTSCTSSLPV